MLMDSEDEISQCDQFSRIHPTNQSEKYFQFFDKVPRSDRLLIDWEKKFGVSGEKRCEGRNILKSRFSLSYYYL